MIWGSFSGKFRAHGDRVSGGLTVQQREHIVDNSVHIDQLTLWRGFPVERTYAVDDFSRTFPISIDSRRGCERPFDVWWFVRKPFDATVGAGDGGRYWLLDFVRQGRSHFPQHARCAAAIFFRLAADILRRGALACALLFAGFAPVPESRCST
jgi:hypothetical protein